MLDLKTVTTEKSNTNSENLSEMSIKEIIDLMNEEDINVVKSIQKSSNEIEKTIEKCVEVLKSNGRIIYVGAGTSGRLGILDSVECPPTFGVDSNTVVGVMAGGENAFVRAKEGSEDSIENAVIDLKKINLNKQDIVIGIAASGRTPYVLSAINYADSIGAKTSGITCATNSKLESVCKNTIVLETGPEVLTGSTRLKAGTATKMVLNMISTISMIGIGKVYKNYMIDVKLTNEKLIQRGINIIKEITNVDEETAKKTLIEAEENVKTAIVMLLLNIDKVTAENKINSVHGNVTKLIDN